MDPEFIIRERFHLYFLRQLAGRLAARPYALKGGICLRFYHRSPRLSEDIDLDIDPAVPLKTLQNNVDAILSGQALAASLRSHGVEAVEFSRPKQTETTQRWKASLRLSGGAQLFTRLEFSRRGLSGPVDQGTPDPELLQAAFLSPFAAAYYGATAMAQLKILALASPSRTAARDLFDLHHLFFQVKPVLDELRRMTEAAILKEAAEKAKRFEYRDFRDQVLPYLSGGLQASYGSPSAFEALRDAVGARLAELAQ